MSQRPKRDRTYVSLPEADIPAYGPETEMFHVLVTLRYNDRLFPPLRQFLFIPNKEELLGIINVCSDATGRLLIIYSALVKCLRKNGNKNEAVYQLFIDFKKAHDSVRREVLYNILMEFGIPKKLIRLIKMCLTETYS